jgi:cyclopropane-fatty-acyl-phospholipid synthase
VSAMLFADLLKNVIQDGAVSLIDSRGKTYIAGDSSEPVCTVRLHRRSLDVTLIFNPALSVPEAYMAGNLTIEDGTLYDFMDLVARNFKRLEQSFLFRMLKLFDIAKFGQYNPITRSRKNVAHHYDLSDDLYNLFLDPDRQYSCAYFSNEDTDLETAQLEKNVTSPLNYSFNQGKKSWTSDLAGVAWGFIYQRQRM